MPALEISSKDLSRARHAFIHFSLPDSLSSYHPTVKSLGHKEVGSLPNNFTRAQVSRTEGPAWGYVLSLCTAHPLSQGRERREFQFLQQVRITYCPPTPWRSPLCPFQFLKGHHYVAEVQDKRPLLSPGSWRTAGAQFAEEADFCSTGHFQKNQMHLSVTASISTNQSTLSYFIIERKNFKPYV